jgi:class I fructose-bisphosphate aldolase
MSTAVDEIVSWYPALTSTQRKNLLKLVNYGRIGGSGKFVILPVDQGFEHGPARSFQPNPAGYDPRYHAELAIKAGCNGYAAPLGAIEAAVDIIAKKDLPVILKVNNHDGMMPDEKDAFPALTSWVEDALRLKAAAVGITIYPGSAHAREMYEQVRHLVSDARVAGLVVVVWAYARGSGLPLGEEAETALDVVSYAVHIAAQLGAHIIKCKPAKKLIALPSNVKRGVYDGLPMETLADRTTLVVQSAFGGRRIIICSGGDAKKTEDLLAEIAELKKGGASGSIVGRNSFQRPEADAIDLLHTIQDIYVS